MECDKPRQTFDVKTCFKFQHACTSRQVVCDRVLPLRATIKSGIVEDPIGSSLFDDVLQSHGLTANSLCILAKQPRIVSNSVVFKDPASTLLAKRQT